MNLIIIAGMPSAGKTTLARKLSEVFGYPILEKDEMKEMLFDHLGYADRIEKRKLDYASNAILLQTTEKLLQKDVFVNIAGGIRVNDPAIDLPVLAAVLSSNMDIALDEKICMTGEVGLAGEIRPVNRIDQRIREAEKLGFEQIIIPAGQKYNARDLRIRVVEVNRVVDAFRILIKK